MNIYQLGFDGENFKSVFLKDRAISKLIISTPLDQALKGTWQQCELIDSSTLEPGLSKLPQGEFWGIEAVDIGLSEIAHEKVGKIFNECGELLPMSYIYDNDASPLHYFRCLKFLSAIDETATLGRRMPDGKKYVGIDRWAFVASRVRDAWVFRDPLKPGWLLCADAFKNLIESHNLKGLYFHLVWSDEPEGRKRILAWEKSVGLNLPPMEPLLQRSRAMR
jgi:hypothetical protein